MALNNSYSALLLSVSSLLLVSVAMAHGVLDPAIEKVCGVSQDPALCASSIAPFMDGKTDAAAVLVKEILATSGAIEEALKTTNGLLKARSDSANSVECLKVCKEVYESAVDDLRKTTDALAAHDLHTVDTMLSAVLTYATTCDDGYDEMGGASPLRGMDQTIRNLAINCLDISQKLLAH